MTEIFLGGVDKNKKGVSHIYPISKGEVIDDKRNVNTEAVIGNIFDCAKVLKCRE